MQTLDLFRNATDAIRLADGEALFREGDKGDRAYVVQTGEIDVQVRGHSVYVAGPGELVGEMALIDSQPRSATAVARGEVGLAPIDEQRFLFLVQQTPFFALTVMRIMAARLRASNTRA